MDGIETENNNSIELTTKTETEKEEIDLPEKVKKIFNLENY